jgi:hypothetical protein
LLGGRVGWEGAVGLGEGLDSTVTGAAVWELGIGVALEHAKRVAQLIVKRARAIDFNISNFLHARLVLFWLFQTQRSITQIG